MTQTAINRNFLSPLNFKFQIKRAPNLNFFVQSVNIPGLSLPDVDVSNPIIRVPYPGDHLSYDELQLSYRVDEDLRNYMELHGWLRSIGKRSYQEYRTISQGSSVADDGIYSDISLIILTSNKNANYEVTFKRAYPNNVSGINFTTTAEDVDYVEASASFRYVSYEIAKVT